MRANLLAAAAIFLLAASTPDLMAQTPDELAAMWQKHHISRIDPSNVRHRDVKKYVASLKDSGVKAEEVGRSVEGREIYQLEWGSGPLKVFLWSQMHGDEPTATSAMLDLLHVLQGDRKKAWASRIAESLTIRFVPMLNPDGAERYQRRNAQDLDINRDALNLKSPEARLLKQLRDSWSPDIGFNLHNQNSLTGVGDTGRQASISLLVVYGDEAKTMSPGHARNRRVASAIVQAIRPMIPGNIGKYDDEFTATAFGDNFSKWGTPVILIETGGHEGRSEMDMVKVNFVAIGTALRVLADGSEKNFSPDDYESLPPNTSGRLMNYVFRNANIPLAGYTATKRMDIGAVVQRRRAEVASPVLISKVGPLPTVGGLHEYDASGFVVIGRLGPLTPNSAAEILFYRVGRPIGDGTPEGKRPEPDAIFSQGKWTKGEGTVPKLNPIKKDQ